MGAGDSGSAMKTLADYINWRNKPEPPQGSPPGTWRPPTLPVMYDVPQTRLFSPLDKDPIIERVFIKPSLPPPRAFPILGNKYLHFFAGAWTGLWVTFTFTCKPIGYKEIQDLVMYDPDYFPEFAKKA